MNEPTLDLLLVVLLLGTLLCAVSLMFLRSSVQRSGSLGSELFSQRQAPRVLALDALRQMTSRTWPLAVTG